MSAKWTLLSVSAPGHFDQVPERPLVGTVHGLSQRRSLAGCRHRESATKSRSGRRRVRFTNHESRRNLGPQG
jgi:hypothetical protein